MPNPLIRGGPANTSREEMTDRTPIAPELEYYEGTNLPYRGVMYHGVEPTERYNPPDGYSGEVAVVYEPPPPEQEPVPVRIVDNSSRFRIVARADNRILNYDVTQRPTQLLPYEENRLRVKIVNVNTFFRVELGFSDQIRDFNGSYPLGATDIELTTKEAIFVLVSDPGASAANIRVGWIAEYEVPVNDGS